MNRVRLALVFGVVLLSGVFTVAQQSVKSDAVLIRDSNNQLFVSIVVGKPGDTIGITGGQVIVNGRTTTVRIRATSDWGPKELEPGTYFVAGDPAGLGAEERAWGLIPQSRIVGTVQVGAMPGR